MALIVGTNSYINVVDADTYFSDNLLDAKWTALSTILKPQALITASNAISRMAAAACKLPIAPASIIKSLREAAAEYGLFLATNPGVISGGGDTTSSIERVKAGSVEVKYFQAVEAVRVPVNVMNILSAGNCLGGAGGQGGIFTTGDTASSAFTQDYGFDRGLL